MSPPIRTWPIQWLNHCYSRQLLHTQPHYMGIHLIPNKEKVSDCKHVVKALADIPQLQQQARLRGTASSWQGMFYVAL